LSVVVPAYNESGAIYRNLSEAVETLIALGYDFEVIVVDDGSGDETFLHAAQLIDVHGGRVRIVRYDVNQGKGNALMCGTSYAKGDYVIFLDADLDLHPRQLPRFFEIMDQTGVDVVIGSKRHPESKVEYPFVRRVYSAVYYTMIRMLFGLPVRDTQTGLKVFKTQVLRDVFPRILVKRFAFDIEVLTNAHRLGYTIADAPVQLEFRRGTGRVKMKDAKSMFIDTLGVFYRMHVLHYYDALPHRALDTLSAAEGSFEVTAAGLLDQPAVEQLVPLA
jgi:glycosyltransferase involved in cell wall biosynthesis